ncbi:unnamed protein product [Arctogadus glacialis]
MPSALCPPGLQGATDLEKHLELLVVENERLKQELKACRTSAAPPPAPPPGGLRLPRLPPRTVTIDAEALRGEVSRWEGQARQRERRLAEVERELLQSHAQWAELQAALEQGHAQLDERRRRRGDVEQRLGLRLQECEEELARQAAAPPPVKYVTQTVEVENAQTGRALAEARAQSGALTDQLHESQRSCIQILVYEGEMQSLEEEKNRVIGKYKREMNLRKKVHNELVRLKGKRRITGRQRNG